MSLLDEAQDRPRAPAESKKRKQSTGGTDVFVWLNALWTKEQHHGVPPTFVMHRFLAAERDYAEFARWLQLHVREPVLVFRTWQGLLPKGRGAPMLPYVAPKKPPQEEALVTRMRQVLAERRSVVEEMITLLKAAGKEADLYAQFGVEAPK